MKFTTSYEEELFDEVLKLNELILEYRNKLTKRAKEKAIEGYNFALERNLTYENDVIFQSYINVATEDLMINEFDEHFKINKV